MKRERKWGDFLKEFDFYKDLPRDLAEPTLIGATISTSCIILMACLFIYNISEFLTFRKTSELLLDVNEEDQFVSLSKWHTLSFTHCLRKRHNASLAGFPFNSPLWFAFK